MATEIDRADCKHTRLDVASVQGVPGFDGPDGSVVVEVRCLGCGQVGAVRIKPADVGFDLDLSTIDL